MTELREAKLTGTAYDRGRIHGDRFSDRVKNNANFYYGYFEDEGISPDTAREYARQYYDVVEDEYEEYADEMRGIADASDVAIEEVTMITMRHTILYSAYASSEENDEEQQVEIDGCTSYGVLPGRSENNHTYLGQNWDWKPPVESCILNMSRDDGPNAVIFTEAGNPLGKFGINEHGIGFAANGLSTPSDGNHPYRTPSHVRGRKIVDSEKFDETLDAVVSEKRPTSRNYLLGHADGEIVNIETTPGSCYYSYPEDGIITHSNHFLHDGPESTFETRIPDSIYRVTRLSRLLTSQEQVTEAGIKSGLRDHFGYPHSICRHADDDNDTSQTNTSLIMDLSDRRLLATDGPPCDTEYREFRVVES
jgi:isopenicillin-N N-acyltransferase-like protein